MEHFFSPEHAVAHVLEKYPLAKPEQKRGFARSVEFALTGHREGMRSMREHRAHKLIVEKGSSGTMSVEEAIALCEEVCFGPLTPEIAIILLSEHCFGDVEGEREEAIRLLGGSGLF